ncbi:SDR family oxidoreductase [Evansella sp. AB-rgal1]|uniref:SDR family oxidoreductase n=1 Tax=Evansella sp. AB-rgal1 TaxID=3242696 RepID=UPI00359D135C
MDKWKDKVILVTGAANGIGKAIAEGYAKSDSIVYIVDIDEKNGAKLQSKWRAKGKRVTFLKGDVSKDNDVKKIVDIIKKEQNELHVLINNAGISKFTSIDKLEFEEWERILHTNVTSVFLFSKYCSSLLENRGAIVNIASTRAIMSEPHSEAYAASKGGIVALTHALAASFTDKKIRVNSISPGWIETGKYEELRNADHEQHFSKRVGNPEDIVRACFFLSDPENDFISGENLVIDGGMTRKMIYKH